MEQWSCDETWHTHGGVAVDRGAQEYGFGGKGKTGMKATRQSRLSRAVGKF